MPRSRLAAALWFLGLVTVALQALALATRYFQPWLSADYIYPQLFAEDVLAGRYPLAGWTLSSAPYFFPDMAVAIVLRALGGAGTVLPAYVVFTYVALAVLAGWSLQRATGTGWTAWLAGVAFVNVLLLWQPVADHAHYLWLLGTVGFHGGAVLLGLASFALWTGGGEGGLSRRRWAVALAVLFLGAISDTLFLTQAAGPLGLGLWLQARGDWRHPLVRAYAKTLGLALGLVVVVRGLLALAGWFKFSKVVRYVPTPTAVGGATAEFLRDLQVTLAPGAWGFLVLAVVALAVVGLAWWQSRRESRLSAGTTTTATGFAVAGLIATTLLPLATAYWRDAHHVRYILPWLVLPGWLALAWLLPKASPWTAGARPWVLLVLWAGLLAVTFPQIQGAALRWPYPERQVQLDEFITRRGLHHGLSDYWRAHEINTLTRAPVRLFALRPSAIAGFWNNNAFWFYDSAAGRLSVPRYDFIITDGLDETALRRRFGEPAERAQAGGLTIWLYSGPAAQTLTQTMAVEVREFVRGRPGEDWIVDRP